MVTTDIPAHYTGSPSSHIGTPHLTINKEATIDLDSTNSFEGMADASPSLILYTDM
jgi:S-adenosylmethionine decarboxylase